MIRGSKLNHGKENIMSKSSKKLLIVGGDSWSNPNEKCYIEYDVKKIWPDIVADFLDMDIINVSTGEAGNSYIHGQIIDAIENNIDRDIVVMANWSQAIRIDPFEIKLAQLTFNVNLQNSITAFGSAKNECQKALRHLYQLHVDDPDHHFMEKEEFWLKVANVSLRDIYLLNEYCKLHDIPLLHHRALPTLSGIEWILKPEIDFKLREEVLEVCKQNQYYQKILKFDNVIGNSNFFEKGSSCFELYHKYFLTLEEKHPNESGHQLIAHSFINKYIELYEEKTTSEPSYVYD